MNRRDFLRRAALVAAGAVAADQLELLDRLGWVRRLFSGWRAPAPFGGMTSGEYIASGAWSASVSAGGPLTLATLKDCARRIQEQRIPLRDRWVGDYDGWHHIEVVRG